jgi:hypothetical protein
MPELNLEDILAEDDKPTGEAKDIVVDDKKPAEKTGPTPEETIESLKAQIAEKDRLVASERERAEKAVAERSTEANRATTAIEDAWKSREASIENAITAAKADLATIKQQLKQARSTGDIDAEIDLEEKLAASRYDLNASEWEKKNLAAQKVEREKMQKIQTAERQVPGFSAKTQDWIAKHPRFNTDDEYQAAAYASHNIAIKKGYTPESDAYFEFVNGRLAKQFPDNEDDPPPPPTQQKQSTAAPPSRSSNTNARAGANGKTVRLSAEQLEAAEFMGMTPAEYAADLIKQNEEKGR